LAFCRLSITTLGHSFVSSKSRSLSVDLEISTDQTPNSEEQGAYIPGIDEIYIEGFAVVIVVVVVVVVGF